MNQRHLLPPADRELVARLENHPDRTEAARRQRLFSGDLRDFEGREAAAYEMATLLRPHLGHPSPRLTRIVLACLLDWEATGAASQPPRQVVQTTQPAATAAPAPARIAAPAPAVPAPITRTPCASAAIEFLRGALAAGERQRREVHAAAGKLGLTPKMLRTARERLGVVVERRGFGLHCRALWRLPASVPSAALTGAQIGPTPRDGPQHDSEGGRP